MGRGERGGGGRVGGGERGGCERRIEVFVKIQKKGRSRERGGSCWGGQADVNEELKFLGKFKK